MVLYMDRVIDRLNWKGEKVVLRRLVEKARLAGSRRIRVGSWNVEFLTGNLFKIVDVLGRHKKYLFKKRDAHFNTFESGGHNTQIDHLLVHRGDLRACKDCRVFPGEACSSQHRLVAMDELFERQRHMREAIRIPSILWKNLNGDAVESFRMRVLKGLYA
uniref:ATPase, F1 complex alpha/beta subunit, N-terminal domain-containing protein n=1 Tax=Tanacetum cinerariifolium TaxID=118510 RepID=A0A6L2MXF0_TANCI|nr:ATPase, F1 complex alpha/beta subunit, N-terminal domain-containing protein [Tanacetum cinerariifolium]